MTATCASPCTAIASMPGLPTRRAIARASWSDARAASASPASIWVNDSDHIACACSGDSGSPSRSSMARKKQVTRHRLVEHLHVLARLLQGHAGRTGARAPASAKATSARSSAFRNPASSPAHRHDQASRSRSSALERLLGVGVEQRGASRGQSFRP